MGTYNSAFFNRLTTPKLISLAVGLSSLTLFQSQAWDNTGHEVVAQIAYDTLSKESPSVKAKLDAIVQADPRPLRQDLLVCAIWPDLNKHRNEVKDPPLGLFTNAPIEASWHFVDIPYEETNASVIANFINMPGTKPIPRHPNSSGNVVTAIRYYSDLFKKSAKSSHPDPRDRADYLSWLVHYVGDVHQPLHCVDATESVGNYTPPESGDAGGNGFLLSGLGSIKELHAFWDDQLDLDDKEKGRKQDNIHPDHATIQTIAQRLESEHPENEFTNQLKSTDPMTWALESYSYRQQVYALTYDGEPDDQYKAFAKTTAEERITLAGYRLAAVLKSDLK